MRSRTSFDPEGITLGAATPLATGATALAGGDILRLGGSVPLDGRLTWVHPDVRGYEPISCYLLTDGPDALLIDTGVPIHRTTVLEQIAQVLGPEPHLSVLLTRFEPDCLGNLGALREACRIQRVYGGGVSNPFDFFDDLSVEEQVRHDYDVELVRQRPGGTVPVGARRQVQLLGTTLRLLTTFWAYDARARALFTSDSFGYLPLAHPDQEPVVDTGSAPVDRDRLRRHLLSKFEWLAKADTKPLAADLAAIFEAHDIETICPSHGCALTGRETVRRHHEALQHVLRDLDAR